MADGRYPGYRFHPTLPNKLVKSQAEDEALGPEWREEPYPRQGPSPETKQAVTELSDDAKEKLQAEMKEYFAKEEAELDEYAADLQAKDQELSKKDAELADRERILAEREAKFAEIEKKNFEKFQADMANQGKTDAKVEKTDANKQARKER